MQSERVVTEIPNRELQQFQNPLPIEERSSCQEIVTNILNMKAHNMQNDQIQPSVVLASTLIEQKKGEKVTNNISQFRSNPNIAIPEIQEKYRQFSEDQAGHKAQKRQQPQMVIVKCKNGRNSTRISEQQSSQNGCSIKSEPAPNLIYENQKINMVKSITQAMKFLGDGIEIKKICFFMCKIEPVVICFSENFRLMAVSVKGKHGMKVINMDEFLDVACGFRTNKMQQYIRKGYRLNEQLCFSFVFSKRTYDFMADSPQIRNRIVEHIKLMKTCI